MEKQDLSHYPSLNVLIIDDQTLVHDTLTSALSELGVVNIKYAENAYYALRLCEQTQFHVVLCAFNVKSDKDGFHLLEEMKFKGYVNKRTVLIFLSADTAEEVVNSIVELQPDDFWAKPLSSQHIKTRLAQTLDVKKTLYSLYAAFDHNQYSKAIYYAERHLLEPELSKYHPNLIRMKGESFLHLREYEEAEGYFSKLLEKHTLSWVYMGYVHALLKQNKLAPIQELLANLQDRPETRFATYDLLAEHYIDHKDYELAYVEMQKAAKLSPRNIERNKKLWDLARLVHDHEGQFKATQAMAKYAKNSIHDSPTLTLNVIRSGIDYASTLMNGQASRIIGQTERILTDFEANPQNKSLLKEQLVIIRARIHNLKEESELAERLVDAQVSLKSNPSLEDNLDKVKVFHELGRREEALIMLGAVKQQISGDNLAGQVINCYIEKEVQQRSEIFFTAKQLNEMAVEHFNRKRFDAAMGVLEQAVTLSPKNARIMLSRLTVLVAIFRHNGLTEEQQTLAQESVETLCELELNERQQTTFQALRLELQQSSIL